MNVEVREAPEAAKTNFKVLIQTSQIKVLKINFNQTHKNWILKKKYIYIFQSSNNNKKEEEKKRCFRLL